MKFNAKIGKEGERYIITIPKPLLLTVEDLLDKTLKVKVMVDDPY